ncbi:GNAT family N-acetyltransferase [Psychrobium sp. 1_MG-2023]|uniref:GNAT family N-acetyltransferase n=1 Tax=Psychrobium sp. 1_MG-2023 TaxID=3062624 RepID=UPI00268E8132|nr:GNAT family N-acetyltransferase [Psychrobium sp. 1_MG-2023]MDP2561883.1 GNAT family N-acetyltransferase [Psychrobium sp. 1_MG-2023]
MNSTLHAVAATWQQHQHQLEFLRDKVNVMEMRTPRSTEFDVKDPQSQHILITDGEQPVACGRITTTGVISRICVLPGYRGQGVGALVLKNLVKLARGNDLETITLSAKLETLEFYTRFGFEPQGQVFMKAGIPRRHASCHINQVRF